MSKNLFITGTGTDIGKTYVAGLMVKKLQDLGKKTAYFKAAMSGNQRDDQGKLIPGDALWVKEISGINQSVEEMCPYVYEHAYSPHLAASIEGDPVDLDVVQERFHRISRQYEYVTVEGSGGILCPLCVGGKELWLEDVIKVLQLPSLIVADAGLGTINHVVLTVEYMKSKGLPVKGILLNRFHPEELLEEDNRKMCERRTGLKVVACVGEEDGELNILPEILTELYE